MARHELGTVVEYAVEAERMIEHLSIRNFKILRDIEVALRPLTVIVGPNASGKSSMLQAIQALAYCLGTSPHHPLGEVFCDDLSPHLIYTRSPSGPLHLGCRGHFFGEEISAEVDISPDKPPVMVAVVEGHRSGPSARGVLGYPTSASMLKLDIGKLSDPSYPRDTQIRLPQNGEGLSSVLASLFLENQGEFRRIVEQLRKVVPAVDSIKFQRVPINPTIGYELIFDMKGAPGILARNVSEGTLLTLGLLTFMATWSSESRIVLIDDLERGLHPKAMRELVEQLRLLQEQNPDTQIIATSHSPYLLDCLEATEVLLTTLDDNGYATVKSLSDHPEYERWKDLMTPGEFWSSVGEDWITKDKKATAR